MHVRYSFVLSVGLSRLRRSCSPSHAGSTKFLVCAEYVLTRRSQLQQKLGENLLKSVVVFFLLKVEC